jgi:hypothetical protein
MLYNMHSPLGVCQDSCINRCKIFRESANIDFLIDVQPPKTAAHQIDVPFFGMPTKIAALINEHSTLGAYQDKSSIIFNNPSRAYQGIRLIESQSFKGQ